MKTFMLHFCLVFVSGWLHADTLPLALDLFETGDWNACRIECVRTLNKTPDSDRAKLLLALSELRMGGALEESGMTALQLIAVHSESEREIAAVAAFELGSVLYHKGENEKAIVFLRLAFETADSKYLFVRSSYVLYLATGSSRKLRDSYAALRNQLLTTSVLWTDEVKEDSAVPGREQSSVAGLPGRLVIAFYRSQIRPVLGSRCSLQPSCSEYAKQSFARFGLLGFPMMADRFFREPSVVAEQARPVLRDGTLVFEDPVDDHVWWKGQ